MPADTDHIRRDALHAARSEVRIIVSKILRRLDSEAKARIEKQLADLEGEVDGTEIGREAARSALAKYVLDDDHEVIDAQERPALDPPDS